MYDVGGSGDWLFTVAPIFIGIIFVIIFIVIIVNLFSGLSQWKKNEESPRLSVPAIVKIKRTNVTRNSHLHEHNNTVHSHGSSTTYFTTFEFESGDRSEFRISGKEFGVLAEGDIGTLTFQGTRYIDFTRKN
ncbi:DUF2500 domain-containing protein [Peribacillus butanolivorans]|uniref:DUF2500 domain-containing protein n=1 Tax=Peribacillus butanolivorans TaxID=421767 RepID=UPI0006A71807|nr:DUF2500 domain-containing protein [Peribacillus butanolivorans]KON67744.1 hypothetical protein AKG34_02125 [Peribacillus butanolivorans]MCO0601220.1 DUF2500 domain-containing protein [Peribacillus butanolivorans]